MPGNKIRQTNVSAETFLLSEVCKIGLKATILTWCLGSSCRDVRVGNENFFPQSLCPLSAQAGLSGRLLGTQGSLQHQGRSPPTQGKEGSPNAVLEVRNGVRHCSRDR